MHHLIASPNATNGNVTISRETNGQVEDITSFFTSGMIGGTISARDGALKTAQDQLDQMASDVTTAYNTQHALGVGLDGNTGRNLFNVAATGAGAAMSSTSRRTSRVTLSFWVRRKTPTVCPATTATRWRWWRCAIRRSA